MQGHLHWNHHEMVQEKLQESQSTAVSMLGKKLSGRLGSQHFSVDTYNKGTGM
jgi:hypothetical protein